MDLGKKVRTGVEPEPIVAPVFNPPTREPIPGFSPDFTPVRVPLPNTTQRRLP